MAAYEGRITTEPASHAFAITPNDSADLAYVTRGLMVTAKGDVKVTMMGGETVVLGQLVAGIVHPVRVVRVWANGTGATGIVGLY